MSSPTQRSLKVLRERGYFCWTVEYWNSFTHRRQDLWGLVDILCLGRDEVIGVQTTSGSNVSARVKKITDHESTPHIRKAGVRLLVHGWTRGKNGRYTLREVDLS